MILGRRYLWAFGLVLLAGLAGMMFGPGFSGRTASAQNVAESYTADAGTMAAMIVKIDEKNGRRVSPAVKADSKAIHGIVVLPADAPLSLSNETQERQVYVATTGTYRVLVSDEEGLISKDDYIALSSVDGVGAKADAEPSVIVGKALTGFDGKTGVKSQAKLKDEQGNDRTVNFGYIEANIDISRNPLMRSEVDNLPGALRSAAEGLANKPVDDVRIYISLVVIVLTTILAGIIMATGIRSGLAAIGRNPLARKSILRNLLQVVLVGFIILIVGLFAVYLLLKL